MAKRISIAGAGSLQPINSMGGAQRLAGSTAPIPAEYVWQSEESASIDLEVLIRVLDVNPPINTPGKVALTDSIYPALRWQIWALGHGDNSLDFPPGADRTVSTTKSRMPQWPVPARGVAVRMNARALRLLVANQGNSTEPLIEISIEPMLAGSIDWRPFPSVDLGVRNTAGARAYFPPHATQWRLNNTFIGAAAAGQYMMDPQYAVTLHRWSTTQTTTIECVLPAGFLFDWQPIPLGAHSWSPPVAAFGNPLYLTAEYR